jgi:hypothetical protein
MLDSTKKYRVGSAIAYTSMYGYPKNRFPVYEIGESGGEGQNVGEIKEERVIGADGQVATMCYYEKNRWRSHGKDRFYASCEALILAVGGTMYVATPVVITKASVDETSAGTTVKKPRAKAPVPAKSRAKVKAKTRVKAKVAKTSSRKMLTTRATSTKKVVAKNRRKVKVSA